MNDELSGKPRLTKADIRFAYFSAIGTWSASEPCTSCSANKQHLIAPLVVQWEPSTDEIGDFSWNGPYEYLFAVKEHVASYLAENGFDCGFYDVEYEPPDSDAPPGRIVWYPYDGPELRWARCDVFIDLDKAASGVELRRACTECGFTQYTFRRNGIQIPRQNWHGEKIFRIRSNGRSLATFVTDAGRQIIEKGRFSNVLMSPAGEIVG